MSQQHSEILEANLGSGRNSFANLEGGAMIVSANILAGGRINNITPRSTAFDRWPFLKTRDEESLHDKISDKVKEGMNSKARNELAKQEREYEVAFKTWSMMAGTEVNPPELDEYPLVKEHVGNVSVVEIGITDAVVNGLNQEEKGQLENESNPLGPDFAPRPMSDEVVKRIREATRNYLTK